MEYPDPFTDPTPTQDAQYILDKLPDCLSNGSVAFGDPLKGTYQFILPKSAWEALGCPESVSVSVKVLLSPSRWSGAPS